MLSSARPLFRQSFHLLKSSTRQLSVSRSTTTRQNHVPLITVSACAITSASMYYYFTNRIKNESKSESEPEPVSQPGSESSPEPSVVEVIEVIKEEVPLTNGQVAEVVEEVVSDIPAGELEHEAEQQGAFNEETGEINWDCPCLGGMASGPCGEEFKTAFSCFVYSKEEPKGIECIEHFKNMQDCFRKYPEVYSDELREEEDVVATEKAAVDQAVMNNDIIESVQEAIVEAKEIEENVKKAAFDLYATAQKKIDDFNKK